MTLRPSWGALVAYRGAETGISCLFWFWGSVRLGSKKNSRESEDKNPPVDRSSNGYVLQSGQECEFHPRPQSSSMKQTMDFKGVMNPLLICVLSVR